MQNKVLIEQIKSITEVINWAKKIEADEVWVITNKSNQAAMALYKSAGDKEDDPDLTMFTFKI